MPDFETVGLPEEGEPIIPVNPLYERQANLSLNIPASVILVGGGGVGCWVALSLVLGGVDNLTIFDGDSLSTHNLNRYPLPESKVGEMKSVALAHWLETLRPKADIRARGMFDPSIHTIVANWIICCTDSLKSRRLCHTYAQEKGMSYIEVGADGEGWTLSPNPPEFSTELEDSPGYTTVPVHVGPCMMAGAAVAYYVLHNCTPVVSHSVKWVKGPIIAHWPNLGGLKFESMKEVDFGEGWDLFTCPDCGVGIEQQLILIIKHHREHYPNKGLREAKEWAEGQIAQLRAVEPTPVEEGGDDPIDLPDELDDIPLPVTEANTEIVFNPQNGTTAFTEREVENGEES